MDPMMNRETQLKALPKEQADKQVAQEAVVAAARSQGKEGNLVMGSDGNLTLASDEQMGSRCERYSWGQNETELTIKFNVAAGTKGKAVSLVTTTKSIKIAACGITIVEGQLHASSERSELRAPSLRLHVRCPPLRPIRCLKAGRSDPCCGSYLHL